MYFSNFGVTKNVPVCDESFLLGGNKSIWFVRGFDKCQYQIRTAIWMVWFVFFGTFFNWPLGNGSSDGRSIKIYRYPVYFHFRDRFRTHCTGIPFPRVKTQPLSKPYKNIKLSTSGVFSITRHPFYLAEILISFSLSLIFGSYVGLAFIPIWWSGLTLHSLNEEEFLEKEFGPLYLEYKSKVRGRIFPIPPFGKSKSIPKYPFKNLVLKVVA